MGEMKLVIDGREVRGTEGMTILDAAAQAGINIPTLCHRPDLKPEGNCRVCVVDVEGSPRLVASCHTPISAGMVIWTRSPKVLMARKVVVELLLAGHTGPCVTDECAGECELHYLAAELEVGPPRFQVKRRRSYPVENISPYVKRDMGRCILCRRCVRACAEIAKKNVFSVAYRGFGSKVVVDSDVPLNKEVCKDCGICIEYCPTSALTKPQAC
jgi:NADH dehydrogenase/NADH:ubiquinone oxidoreductase subunit G